MINKKIVSIAISLVFVLTGCSYTGSSIEQLISPPKLSAQQNEIYDALEESKGKSVKLKYPKKGDYTSAFLINNLDDEPSEEAIVFFENPNNDSPTFPLRINVLDQRNGEWVSTFETGVEASEVEKVNFVTDNDNIYIIIGFNQLGQGDKIVKLYTYSEQRLKEVSSALCNNYEVFDIDGDGLSEVVTITAKGTGITNRNAKATAYDITPNGIKIISEADMDPAVNQYINVNGGKLSNGTPALYLDGARSSTNLSTEILTLQGKQLVNQVYNTIPELNLAGDTIRFAGSFSLDLDNDGVYLVPNIIPALGYENTPKHQALIFTDWYEYNQINRSFNVVKRSYIDYKLGFIFTLPEKWENIVTIEKVANENEVIFYEYGENLYNDSEKLLSIKVVQRSEYNKTSINNTHRPLKDNGQLIYLYRLYDNNSDLAITEKDIRQYFNLLQGGSSNEENPGM